MIKSPQVFAKSWGYPLKPSTYSGLPYAIFNRYRAAGRLAGASSLRPGPFQSILGGRLSLPRILSGKRFANPLWRYTRAGQQLVARAQRRIDSQLSGEVVLQFGVGGRPTCRSPFLCHVELPIEAAIEDPVYSKYYGFADSREPDARDAIAMEAEFLDHCDLIWTNTAYTANLFLPRFRSKIQVLTPGVKIDFEPKDWKTRTPPEILFIGRNWEGKGGPLLLAAVRLLQQRKYDVRLTIIGCSPQISDANVEVLGRLRMDRSSERDVFQARLQSACVFCMPSYFETTGMVFLEAACCNLPVVMLRIPQTDEIFPGEFFCKVEEPDPEFLADAIEPFVADFSLAREAGVKAGAYARAKHGPEAFFRDVDRLVEDAWLKWRGYDKVLMCRGGERDC